MKKTVIQILWPLFLMGIAFSIGKWVCNSPNPKPQYFEKPNFKPDTFHKGVYRPDTLKRGDSMPPKKVLTYDTPIKPKPDTVWIDTSKITFIYPEGPTTIDLEFLTLYPYASKLIAGKFTGQGFSLDLLDTSGKIRTLQYETLYDNFDYGFNGRHVTYAPKKRNTIPKISKGKKRIYTESNIYLGYEAFNKLPIVAVDGSISYKKFGVYSRLGTDYSPILSAPTFRAELGLKLKLK